MQILDPKSRTRHGSGRLCNRPVPEDKKNNGPVRLVLGREEEEMSLLIMFAVGGVLGLAAFCSFCEATLFIGERVSARAVRVLLYLSTAVAILFVAVLLAHVAAAIV